MNLIRCCACQKLLAKASEFAKLQIKCARCKTVNHFSLSVAQNTLQEAHEAQIIGNLDDKSVHQSTPAIRGPEKNVFKGISQYFGHNP